MSLLKELLNMPKSIKDINDLYNYKDEHPQGEGDSELVACGQDGTYNELWYIYDTHLKPSIDEGKITEQQAINALGTACKSLANPRLRTDFYHHLEKKLGIKIKEQSKSSNN